MALTIVTNGKPRDIIDCWELSEEERKEFNYIDWDNEYEYPEATFFRYKGELYDLGNFEPAIESFKGWDAFMSEGFFMGILLKWVPNSNWEQVIIGRFYA